MPYSPSYYSRNLSNDGSVRIDGYAARQAAEALTPLMRTVLATMCYYDALDYPLTAFEAWRYLTFEDPESPAQYRTAQTVGAVREVLGMLVRDQHLVERNGFFVLKGREELIDARRRRSVLSVGKLNRMRRAVAALRWVPFVRMVFVTGRLAMKHGMPKSDWDVLIVLKKGRIWTGRFLVTVMTQVFGRRRTDKNHADHLCLNYYITTGSLAISLDDRYSAHEYMAARPMFASLHPKRFLEANRWILRFRPHFEVISLPNPYMVWDSVLTHRVRRAGEWICSSKQLEAWMRKWQRKKILANPKTYAKGAMIIANDQELAFLPQPHSPRVLEAYHERCRAHGLKSCA